MGQQLQFVPLHRWGNAQFTGEFLGVFVHCGEGRFRHFQCKLRLQAHTSLEIQTVAQAHTSLEKAVV